VTADHIQGLFNADQGEAWSTGEFVHAIALMTSGDLMGKFASGCGIVEDGSLALWQDNKGVALLTPRNDSAQLQTAGNSPVIELPPEISTETMSVAEKLQQGDLDQWKAEDEAMDEVFMRCNEADMSSRHQSSPDSSCALFTGGHTREYEDFDCSAKEYGIYHVEDFPWDDDVVPRLDRHYNGVGSLLDEEMRVIRELTYHTFRDIEGVDTLPFRDAIWYYVQRITGLFHDDYDYREVNLLVNREFKNYCKKVTCTPDEVNFSDFANLGYDLSVSEKVHAVLIAVEARKYSAIMYGMRALDQFVKSR